MVLARIVCLGRGRKIDFGKEIVGCVVLWDMLERYHYGGGPTVG